MDPRHVVFVASECEPWAKTGGLGDVVDALARALGRVPGVLDEPVEVFLPRYRSVPVPADRPIDTVREPHPRSTRFRPVFWASHCHMDCPFHGRHLSGGGERGLAAAFARRHGRAVPG